MKNNKETILLIKFTLSTNINKKNIWKRFSSIWRTGIINLFIIKYTLTTQKISQLITISYLLSLFIYSFPSFCLSCLSLSLSNILCLFLFLVFLCLFLLSFFLSFLHSLPLSLFFLFVFLSCPSFSLFYNLCLFLFFLCLFSCLPFLLSIITTSLSLCFILICTGV